jgi:hypothetical protein
VSLRFDPDPAAEIIIDGKAVQAADLLSRNDFDGTHTEQGIVALWGPPVRKGVAIEHATLRDIAPTVFALLGCPTSRQLSGKVLDQALLPRSSARLRRETVDAFPPPLHRSTPPLDESPAAAEEIRKKLKALGYLQ